MNTHKHPYKELVDLLSRLSDPREMEAALEALLTPKEAEELENRLQIFRMLLQDIPQREIATRLNVGIATVTRGAAALRNSRFFESYTFTTTGTLTAANSVTANSSVTINKNHKR
jgi:Trp operon repressor